MIGGGAVLKDRTNKRRVEFLQVLSWHEPRVISKHEHAFSSSAYEIFYLLLYIGSFIKYETK